MKEAAGEANMTVIVVVLIGVIAAVGLWIVPKALNRTKFRTCCTDAGGYIVTCPEEERRNKLCCQWRSDDTDHAAFVSAYRECASIFMD